MRAALITLAGPPPSVADRSLALRQLDFALAAGCERIYVLGNGASGDAVVLRHAAEAARARFIALSDSHVLLGALPATDELLVLAPALLPEAAEAIEALARGPGIAVFPAEVALAAGFERIDKDRAWAGALVMPGSAVERLAQLDPASEPTSALLRIALQASVPARPLDPAILATGGWTVLGPSTDLAALDRAWLARNLGRPADDAPSSTLAGAIISRLGLTLLSAQRAVDAAAALLPPMAVVLAALGLPVAGLALLVPATLAGALGAGLVRLARAPFARLGRHPIWQAIAPYWRDAALAACLTLGIDGEWLHRLFPPIMLALLLSQPGAPQKQRLVGQVLALFRDRALLALAFAVAAWFGHLEPAVMGAVAVLLAGQVLGNSAAARITPD